MKYFKERWIISVSEKLLLYYFNHIQLIDTEMWRLEIVHQVIYIPVSIAVSQGTRLGPLLYTLYSKDIFSAWNGNIK